MQFEVTLSFISLFTLPLLYTLALFGVNKMFNIHVYAGFLNTYSNTFLLNITMQTVVELLIQYLMK